MKSIYLDINGCIEYKDQISPYFKEFLLKVIDTHKVYWLTTHCQDGSSEAALKYLGTKTTDQGLLEAFKKIIPTKWNMIKPQGINYEEDFIWYDDKPLSFTEEKYLQKFNALDKFYLVDLNEEPDFWKLEGEKY
ncbi:hypothetical protein COY05_02255 [Candidatus Peregrinibacteria bacterium CG_4_10_14_0_2_um_filter_38_24]|nr:MAG: hypothetical protein COY05_02255 [Candidatus Peregrinibacteria bacterium CG_4_10_14_0_2_um_filter_38_24]